jgi:predicted nucleic acid-binding protein
MKIIADASPLIALASIGHLSLLPTLFDETWLPEAVFYEATAVGKPYAQSIRAFAQGQVTAVRNQLAVQMLINDVDLGEAEAAEAIVLAHELGIDTILIDDAKGRRFARLHHLHPIGTLGVLLQAKKMNLLPTIKPLVNQLIENQIRISPRLYQQALQLAGE